MTPSQKPLSRPTLLFDLDGTLIHSLPDLTASLNVVLESEGRQRAAEDAVRLMVGDGVEKLVERAFGAADGRSDGAPPLAALVARFLSHYEIHGAEKTRPYAGVVETLELLIGDGYRAAICTNKPETATREVVHGLGLERFFAAIAGGDSFAVKKPDPGHVTALLDLLSAEPSKAVFVGDAGNDVAAAHAAGLPVIVVAYGYARVPAAELGADAVIERFAELPEALERLR